MKSTNDVTGPRRLRLAFHLITCAIAAAACGVDSQEETGLTTDPQLAVVGQRDTPAPLYEMENPGRLTGRYIVRFRSSVRDPDSLVVSLVSRFGGRAYRVLRALRGYWGELPDSAIGQLRLHQSVAYIEADVAVPILDVGDTTQQSAPWPLDRVDQRLLPLSGAYQYSTTGAGVRIWIIDTGVDRNEPELAGRVDETWSVSNNGKDPYAPCNDHGTRVARVAAGATRGVAKRAKVHSARVDDNCSGTFSTGAAVFAFEFIADNSPRPAVINYSAGHACGFFGCGQTVDDAAKYAQQRGVTVVVAAGNDGQNACDFTPAHVSELITVAASNANDQRIVLPGWWASNYGSCVDLFAPVEDNGGTSLATPMVTGVAALYLQLYPAAGPSSVISEILSKATQNVLSNIGTGSPNRLLFSKPPTLTASISGAATMGPFTQCTWNGVYSGGQPSYQLEWWRNGLLVATGTSYSAGPGEFSSFAIELIVRDGVGRSAASLKQVTVDPNNTDLVCAM